MGQYVSFADNWNPALPDGTQKDPAQWAFTGTYYNDGTNAALGETPPTCSINYFLNTSMLTSNTTTAWWVSGGINNDANTPATYHAVLGEGLTFANGQYVAIAAHGLFNMFRPHTTVNAATGVISLSNYISYNSDGDSTNYFGVHFGTYYDYGTPGVEFVSSVIFPTNILGTMEWVQVVNSGMRRFQTNDNSGAWYRLQASHVLDKVDPYDVTELTNTVAWDVPSQPLYYMKNFSSADDFTMRLMFTPTGGHRVPLSILNWHWSADASLSGTNWSLTSTNWYVDQQGTDTLIYPEWTNRIQNFKFQPE